jgi:hypothetical protein
MLMQTNRQVFQKRHDVAGMIMSRITAREEYLIKPWTRLVQLLMGVQHGRSFLRIPQVKRSWGPDPIINIVGGTDFTHADVHLCAGNRHVHTFVTILKRDVFDGVGPEQHQFSNILIILLDIPRVV